MGESLKQYKKIQRYNLIIGTEIFIFIVYLIGYFLIVCSSTIPSIIRDVVHLLISLVFIITFVFLFVFRHKAKEEFVSASALEKEAQTNPNPNKATVAPQQLNLSNQTVTTPQQVSINKASQEKPDGYAIAELYTRHKLISIIVFTPITALFGISCLLVYLSCIHNPSNIIGGILFFVLFPLTLISAIIVIINFIHYLNARSELKELKEKLEIKKRATEHAATHATEYPAIHTTEHATKTQKGS